MYVKDLIERLQKCNPEAVALIYASHDYFIMDNIIENTVDEVPSVEFYGEGFSPEQYKEWFIKHYIEQEKKNEL
jgi:hypothetical protein